MSVIDVLLNDVTTVSEGISRIYLTDYALKDYVDHGDDSVRSLFSSYRTAAAQDIIDDSKQDTLTAGEGITISNRVIKFNNEYGFITSSYHDSSKQDVLTPGNYIVISSEGIISSNPPVINTRVNGVSVLNSEGIADIDLTGLATISLLDSEAQRLDHRIDAEIIRATSEELRLQNALDSESVRISNLESINFATKEWVNSEGFLKQPDILHLASIAYVDSEDQLLLSLINQEVRRATISEQELHNYDLQLRSYIDSESYRATLEEQLINLRLDSESSRITEEISRSTREDVLLSNRIDSETARAELIESGLQIQITSEGIRASRAEYDLSVGLQAESSRAISQETILSDLIDSESNRIDDLYDTKQDNLSLGNNIGWDSEGKLEVKIRFDYDPITKVLNIYNW